MVENGVILALNAGPYRGDLARVDLGGLSLSPGLIDLMLLGGFGRSILRDDPLTIAAEYIRLGVTACQFCVGTLPWESMHQVAEKTRAGMARDAGEAARILGLYLEGPFQQPDLTGASLGEYALVPSPEHVERVIDGLGPAVTLVNVAPGLQGAPDAVRRFREAGKVVAMAHSNADVEAIRRCVDAGTTVLGHAWDNNSGRVGDSGVQQPTLEHVALTDDRIRSIHLICDGTHVHPVMIDILLRCRGVESICLVTDGNQRSGCQDGSFLSDDGRRFTKADGVCRTDGGWLAGSALLLPDMFRNFVRFTGLPPAVAIRTVTLNPAASLGLDNRLGRLAPGRVADLVAWDRQLRVCRVWRGGCEVAAVSSFAEVRL